MLEAKTALKHWCEVERSHGHRLTLTDLWEEFKDIVALKREKVRVAEACGQALEEDIAWSMAAGERVEKVSASQKYLETTKVRLQSFCELRLLKPQRVTKLSAKEEQALVRCTWQMMDRALYLAFCSPIEELTEQGIPEAAAFVEGRKQTALVFADQVPFWVGMEDARQLYLSSEWGDSLKQPRENVLERSSQAYRVEEEPGGLVAAGVSGMAAPGKDLQKRGPSDAKAKVRITVELRQVITGYGEGPLPPVGL